MSFKIRLRGFKSFLDKFRITSRSFFVIESKKYILDSYPIYVSINLAVGEGTMVTDLAVAGINTVCP